MNPRTPMIQYTSAQILIEDEEHDDFVMWEISEQLLSFGVGIRYLLTAEELAWYNFTKDGTAIGAFLSHCIDESSGVITLTDYETMSEALDRDGGDNSLALCLSEDSALQRIFFWCYTVPCSNDEEDVRRFDESMLKVVDSEKPLM